MLRSRPASVVCTRGKPEGAMTPLASRKLAKSSCNRASANRFWLKPSLLHPGIELEFLRGVRRVYQRECCSGAVAALLQEAPGASQPVSMAAAGCPQGRRTRNGRKLALKDWQPAAWSPRSFIAPTAGLISYLRDAAAWSRRPATRPRREPHEGRAAADLRSPGAPGARPRRRRPRSHLRVAARSAAL